MHCVPWRPLLVAPMALCSLRMSSVLGPDDSWENLGISEKQGGRGRLNPGKDLVLRPRLLRTAAQILECQAPRQRKRWTQGFRGLEQVVNPNKTEWEPSVPRTNFIYRRQVPKRLTWHSAAAGPTRREEI